MKSKYTSADSAFARYLKLKLIKQRDGESVESYYQRFDENIDRQKIADGSESEEDEHGGPKRGNELHNFMFVENLHAAIRPGFLRLPEAKDFQKKDLYEIRQLATRVEESVSHFTFVRASAAKSMPNSNSNANFNTNKSSKKFWKRDTDEISREKLSPSEKSFLKSNIAKGGGSYIFPNVQKKLE